METLPSIDTEIKLIIGNQDSALSYASLSTKAVGLVQQEFVVSNHIGIHPNAVLFPDKVSELDQIIIDEISLNYPLQKNFFVCNMSEVIGSNPGCLLPPSYNYLPWIFQV